MTFHQNAIAAALGMALLTLSGPARAADPIVHQVALPAGQTWCSDGMITGLFTEINALRASLGVPALRIDQLGMKDAELRASQFAAYMEAHPPGSPGFNPHTGWDTTAASIGYNAISENLAWMTIDPAYIVSVVWQDTLHRAAMLASDANVAGVSCLYSNGVAYWTYEPGVGSSAAPSPSPGTTPTLDSEEWAFVTLINNYRAQNGLGPLQVSVALQNAARWMSTDMAAKNYASHTDSLGRSPQQRFAAFGYTYYPSGENIAGGFGDAQTAFNQWVNACDPDASGACTYAHRKNMLGQGYNAMGIARQYSTTSTYGWYWTNDFGGVVEQAVPPPGTSTPPAAPAVSFFASNPATVAAGQSATLTWTVSGATAVAIDNGVGNVSGKTSATVTPAATTTYTLTATNSGGSSTARTTVTVTAAPTSDTQPPSVPTGVTATAKSPTSVEVRWNPSTDNIAVAGYQILRSGAVIASAPASAGVYTDANAAPNSTYSYAVRAFDAAGNQSPASAAAAATTPPAPSTQTCPAASSNAFTGCYFNNTSLAGTPAVVRTDSQINFTWAPGTSPAPGITPDQFSVRWEGTFTFQQADYTFTATTSDGMRVIIDGIVALDRWLDQASITYTFRRNMSAGQHTVLVEYYTRTGLPIAQLTWQGGAGGAAAPVATLSASPSSIAPGQSATLTWNVSGASTITIDNGIGAAAASGSRQVQPANTVTYTLTAVNGAGTTTASATVTVGTVADTQPPSAPGWPSARAVSATQVALTWTASQDNVAVAAYQVLRNGSAVATVGGGVLSYVDTVQPGATYTYSVRAQDAAGNYSPAASAPPVTTPSLPPSGACPGPATGAFTGCYYGNLTLSGAPALTRVDPAINFDWGYTAPAPSLSTGNLSVRWQGVFAFEAGTWSFNLMVSDGVRLYIDGVLALDRWRDQAPSRYSIRQDLSQGPHEITVEYYGKTGWPTAHLSWQPL